MHAGAFLWLLLWLLLTAGSLLAMFLIHRSGNTHGMLGRRNPNPPASSKRQTRFTGPSNRTGTSLGDT